MGAGRGSEARSTYPVSVFSRRSWWARGAGVTLGAKQSQVSHPERVASACPTTLWVFSNSETETPPDAAPQESGGVSGRRGEAGLAPLQRWTPRNRRPGDSCARHRRARPQDTPQPLSPALPSTPPIAREATTQDRAARVGPPHIPAASGLARSRSVGGTGLLSAARLRFPRGGWGLDRAALAEPQRPFLSVTKCDGWTPLTVCAHMYTCVCTCLCSHVCASVHMSMCAHVCVHLQMSVCAHEHVSVYVCMCTHMPACPECAQI